MFLTRSLPAISTLWAHYNASLIDVVIDASTACQPVAEVVVHVVIHSECRLALDCEKDSSSPAHVHVHASIHAAHTVHESRNSCHEVKWQVSRHVIKECTHLRLRRRRLFRVANVSPAN